MVAVPSPRVDRKERYWGIMIAITHSSSFYKLRNGKAVKSRERGYVEKAGVANGEKITKACTTPYVAVRKHVPDQKSTQEKENLEEGNYYGESEEQLDMLTTEDPL